MSSTFRERLARSFSSHHSIDPLWVAYFRLPSLSSKITRCAFIRLLFAKALALKVNSTAEVCKAIHRALAIAVENLHLG